MTVFIKVGTLILAVGSAIPMPMTGSSWQALDAAYSGSSAKQQTPTPGQVAVGKGLPGPQTLTLEQALALAETSSPQITAALSQAEGAQGRIQSARAYPNPGLEILAGRQYAKPIYNPGVPGVLQQYSFIQPLEISAVRRTRIEAAQRGKEGSDIGVIGVRRGVRAQVKRAFFDALRREEEVAHAGENLALVQDLRRRTEVSVNVGEAARLELIRAEAETTRASAAVRSAQLSYVTAISALRATIGAPLPPDVQPTALLDDPVSLPPLSGIRATLLERFPTSQQAQLEIQRSRAVLANELALRLPQPSLYAEYDEQPDIRFYRFGVSVPLALWDRRKGPIAEATAALQTAQAFASQRRLELTAALERAYGQYQIANEQVQAFAGGALRQAEAAVQGAEAAYRFGERGILEVLDAQRVLQAVRGELLDAQYERQNALIDLEELGAVQLKEQQ